MKLNPIHLFHTPKSWKELDEYLGRFSGSERVVATTCAMMAWNLACFLQDAEPSYSNEEEQ